MRSRLRAHLTGNVVAYAALFVALGGTSYAAVTIGSKQITNNSVRSVDLRDNDVASRDIKNRSIKGIDVARGTLKADNFAAGQLPAGPKGEKGDRGPSFGDGKGLVSVPIACNADVVVSSQVLTVTQPSRIWVQANGAILEDGSGANAMALTLRLRDGADTTTLGASGQHWGVGVAAGQVVSLAPGGLLFAGPTVDVDPAPPVLTVAPGTYILQLVANAFGLCVSQPRFGLRKTGTMSYMLLGTG